MRLLVIDDSQADMLLALAALEGAAVQVEAAERVETLAELQDALEGSSWDLCLLDWVLPGMTTPEVMRLLRQSKQPHLPCIVWSGRNDAKIAFITREVLGAAAFLPKAEIHRLAELVRAAARAP